jgi:hypothetical protein
MVETEMSANLPVASHHTPVKLFRNMPTLNVEQVKKEEKRAPTFVRLGRRVLSTRVSYSFPLAVACWLAFAFAIYFLKVLGFLDAR